MIDMSVPVFKENRNGAFVEIWTNGYTNEAEVTVVFTNR
jgi:hypothetical protein